MIREDPMKQWRFLPRCVRPHFAKRVCVTGPESTGKTTLARRLAERFDTAVVPEYARTLLEAQRGALAKEDIERIARGQMASEDALAREANRVLVCDTDVLATTIWSDVLFGESPAWVREEADRRTYDVYLLCDADVPYVDDPVRYLPADARHAFFARCARELDARGRRWVKIAGDWDERFATACAAVESLLR
jgi:HTH-type transcriptional repressor of NAD biosynthesis genes